MEVEGIGCWNLGNRIDWGRGLLQTLHDGVVGLRLGLWSVDMWGSWIYTHGEERMGLDWGVYIILVYCRVYRPLLDVVFMLFVCFTDISWTHFCIVQYLKLLANPNYFGLLYVHILWFSVLHCFLEVYIVPQTLTKVLRLAGSLLFNLLAARYSAEELLTWLKVNLVRARMNLPGYFAS